MTPDLEAEVKAALYGALWEPEVRAARLRAERAEAERDALAAAIERVRALCAVAESAPNPYADQGAVAQIDLRDLLAALDGTADTR